jgi:hypothetical protein
LGQKQWCNKQKDHDGGLSTKPTVMDTGRAVRNPLCQWLPARSRLAKLASETKHFTKAFHLLANPPIHRKKDAVIGFL